jgi:hypothetical protein
VAPSDADIVGLFNSAVAHGGLLATTEHADLYHCDLQAKTACAFVLSPR